jgi:hypothetical protein
MRNQANVGADGGLCIHHLCHVPIDTHKKALYLLRISAADVLSSSNERHTQLRLNNDFFKDLFNDFPPIA